jgi:hypothetical protein
METTSEILIKVVEERISLFKRNNDNNEIINSLIVECSDELEINLIYENNSIIAYQFPLNVLVHPFANSFDLEIQSLKGNIDLDLIDLKSNN